jgi:membrane protein YdbS with pleckstrin-like domain
MKGVWFFINKERKMKLSPPTNLTFWIAVVLGVLGILGTLVTLPFVSANAFWFVAIAFILLALGVLIKKM